MVLRPRVRGSRCSRPRGLPAPPKSTTPRSSNLQHDIDVELRWRGLGTFLTPSVSVHTDSFAVTELAAKSTTLAHAVPA